MLFSFCGFPFHAPMGSTSIPLLTLKVGDVISLDIPEKTVALVDDVPLMECWYGQQGGKYALKIDRFLSCEEPEPALGGSNG